MITEKNGEKYILQGDAGKTLLIDFTEISEDEVLLALLDRVEYLKEKFYTGYEDQYFNALSLALIYYYERKRKVEISVK